MRILVGMPEQGAQGGPAACEPPFIDELRRLGHEVEEEVYVYAKVNVGFGSRAERVLKTARVFRNRLRQSDFDLVHINTSFDTRALLRDAAIVPRLRVKRTKVFLKFHGSDGSLLERSNPALAVLIRRVLSRADGIGVLSSEERENFLRAGVPENKVFVVKNVVEVNTAQRNPEFLRQWNLPVDRPLLLFIGRFIPAKGLLDVILACGLCRDAGQNFLLLCVGDGPQRAEAEALVAKHQLQPWVRFFGYIPEEDTRQFYANSDLLLFPTYHIEGFPMVIFNAAANGLPIVTTRIRAAADYLREPENCFWVEPKNPEMLARQIQQLVGDPDLRSAMALQNRKLAQQFTAEIVAPEYLSIYRELIAAKAEPAA
ncbi:MAG: glycosyltransferase family 4 protein [Pyrinomonadaceae bacterium]